VPALGDLGTRSDTDARLTSCQANVADFESGSSLQTPSADLRIAVLSKELSTREELVAVPAPALPETVKLVQLVRDTVVVAVRDPAVRAIAVAVDEAGAIHMKDVIGWLISIGAVTAAAIVAWVGWGRSAKASSDAILQRQNLEDERNGDALIMRIRYTLEGAIGSCNSIRRFDEKRPIGPELLDGLLVEWDRYDRASDHWPLLKEPLLQEEVEDVLGFMRMVSHQIKNAEQGYQKEARERGKLTPAGIELPPGVIEKFQANRKHLLGSLEKLGRHAQAALEKLDAKWPPPKGHVPPTMPAESAEAPPPSTPQIPSVEQ